MEVNKEEAIRCRDLGATALRNGQNARAVKMFTKSLQLYPLPGVKALLGQAEKKLEAETRGNTGGESSANGSSSHQNNNNTQNSDRTTFGTTRSGSTASTNSAPSLSAGESGRAYTEDQVRIVQQVLRAKEGGRGAHYRVLGIEHNSDEAQIKKAYRKLALKLHPDKNSAPHADEAFKAVGLAYATLSDSQKRTIYDRYGEEDPDNRGGGGGGMRRGPGNMHFHGQDVNPEDIFNMFFGGGMPQGAGGPGFRVYTSGFGPGFAFGGHPNMGRTRTQQQQRQQQQDPDIGFSHFLQFLPLALIILLSFFNMPGEYATGATGGSRYFSLTPISPFTNPLHTKLTKVKDIPYYVTEKFLRTIHRDIYQLSQVERMVEKSYERYLFDECKNQKAYKRKLESLSAKNRITEDERTKLMKKAAGFELTRCLELEDLFPQSVSDRDKIRQSEF